MASGRHPSLLESEANVAIGSAEMLLMKKRSTIIPAGQSEDRWQVAFVQEIFA